VPALQGREVASWKMEVLRHKHKRPWDARFIRGQVRGCTTHPTRMPSSMSVGDTRSPNPTTNCTPPKARGETGETWGLHIGNETM